MTFYIVEFVLTVAAGLVTKMIWRCICKRLDSKESNGSQPN